MAISKDEKLVKIDANVSSNNTIISTSQVVSPGVFLSRNSSSSGTSVTFEDNSSYKVYNRAPTTFSEGFTGDLIPNDIITFGYTGVVKSVTLPAGKYLITAVGASGDSLSSAEEGHGSSVSGNLIVSTPTTYYVCVGGRGNSTTGGYNGGGAGGPKSNTNYTNGQAGGGATHIATSSGVLSSVPSSNVILVAGGGGGGVQNYNGGNAGYPNGDDGGSKSTSYTGKGGTQFSGGAAGNVSTSSYNGTAGSYGQGGAGAKGYYGGGGGGGGYYGGGAGCASSMFGGSQGGGGGGSSYYNSSKISNFSYSVSSSRHSDGSATIKYLSF